MKQLARTVKSERIQLSPIEPLTEAWHKIWKRALKLYELIKIIFIVIKDFRCRQRHVCGVIYCEG